MAFGLRLHVVFLAVLSISVIGASLAAWGITYASSHARVTGMADLFTSLASTSIGDFNALVGGLLQNSSNTVTYILQMETAAGVQRINETSAQVTNTATDLMAHAQNSTAQSETQINSLVAAFAAFMSETINDFEGVASEFATEVRYEFAMKVEGAFSQMLQSRVDVLPRVAAYNQWGVSNVSTSPLQPVAESDVLLLTALCSWGAEVDPTLSYYVGSMTGRFYFCTPSENLVCMSSMVPNGTAFARLNLTWYPPVPLAMWKQWLATQPPNVTEVLSSNCTLAPQCREGIPLCGYDPRCRPWMADSFGLTVGQLLTTPVYGNTGNNAPIVTASYPILDLTTTPPTLLGDVGVDFFFNAVDSFLSEMGTSAGTHVAVLYNDDVLTLLGSVGIQCPLNVTPSGPPSLPVWSSLRSCDPRIQALAVALLANKSGITNTTSLLLNDTLWNVFPSAVSSFQYFVAVGMELEAMYGAIWATQANATDLFSELWASERFKLAATANQTRAYMQAVEAGDLLQTQLMRTSLLAQLADLANASQALLETFQAASTQRIADLMQLQLAAIDALQAAQLQQLNVTAGWTIGVVVAIFLFVLLVGNFGVMRITESLTDIIGLMESVAMMKVEHLEVPQKAPIAEVARIQCAFQVLIARLAEYKSFMPASLFHTPPDSPTADVHATESDTDPATRVSNLTSDNSSHNTPKGAEAPERWRTGGPRKGPVAELGRLTRRQVAALVVNVRGFCAALDRQDHSLDAVFATYITVIHEAIAKARGNLDCVLGDQIFATFNAHIPCGDPVTAAAAAAVDLLGGLAKSKAAGALVCHVGLSFGAALAGPAGYARFKTVAALGFPMKMAALMTRLSDIEKGAVLCDHSVAERVKFTYVVHPIDLVYFPSGQKDPAGPRPMTIYVINGHRELAHDEWLYQVQNTGDDWEVAFSKLAMAKTCIEAKELLQEYLQDQPKDEWAQRLSHRLPLWTPGLGIPMCETADRRGDIGPAAASSSSNRVRQVDALLRQIEGTGKDVKAFGSSSI